MNSFKRVFRWILCNIFQEHEWTCKAREGIRPDKEKVAEDYIGYFMEYSQSYCKYCKRPLKYSARIKRKKVY